jgi:serine/threonine protein kinase
MMWADEAADTMPMLRMPDGQYFPDDRGVANFEPSWDPDPFHTSPPPRRRSRFGSRYLVCEPFTQRGKGGVFKALDLAETPITPCVVKEGRRHGETDWSGRDGRAYLKAEAAALAELTATGVRGPSIRDMFEEARNLYLVLDYLGERTLEDLVRESGVLPVPEALRLAAAFADLVADVHEAGWAWRDVKPRNVVVGSDGGLHAVDFEGSCRADARNVPLWGSVGYLPPQPFDPSSDQIQNDLFALGVSCYQIVVGSRAFALDVQSIKATPVGRRRNHLPPGARGVIGALLHSQPQRRIPARVASAALIASASASV